MKKKMILKKAMAGLVTTALAMGLFLSVKQSAYAASEVYTVTVAGTYRDPFSGTIEDSGGEDQYALGQSMTESMVDTAGLLVEDESGQLGFQFRLHLMDNISSTNLYVKDSSSGSWQAVSYATTGSTDESVDFYVPISSESAAVKANCFVDAMGRAVTFFISFSGKTSGNSTSIKEYSGSDSQSDSSTDATQTQVAAAAGTSSSASSATASVSSTDSPDNLGLTIGTAANEEDSETDGESDGNLFDDSIWIVLFGVVFSAVFLAGLLLIFIFIMVRKIQRNHDDMRRLNMRKYDQYQEETVDEDLDLLANLEDE